MSPDAPLRHRDRMTELFFDVAVLRTDGIAGPDGTFRTFAALGLADGERLRLHARQLTIESAPFGRHLLLVADTLTAKVPLHYTDTGFRTDVEVWAQQISGPLSISSRGRTGPQGAQGAPGTPAKWHWEIFTGSDDGGPIVKPIRTKELDEPAGRGGTRRPRRHRRARRHGPDLLRHRHEHRPGVRPAAAPAARADRAVPAGRATASPTGRRARPAPPGRSARPAPRSSPRSRRRPPSGRSTPPRSGRRPPAGPRTGSRSPSTTTAAAGWPTCRPPRRTCCCWSTGRASAPPRPGPASWPSSCGRATRTSACRGTSTSART